MAGSDDPTVTAYKTSPITLYDADGRTLERLVTRDLPAPPLAISDTNEFGYFQVNIKGRLVYIRPADVQHNVRYCAENSVTQQSSGTRMAAGKPPGVRRGASEGGRLCLPR